MDDFEPNYSHTNRGSIWITLLALESPQSTVIRFKNIYPIAIGPKGSNHQPVLKKIMDDLKSVENPNGIDSYNGSKKGKDNFFSLEVMIPDQPER